MNDKSIKIRAGEVIQSHSLEGLGVDGNVGFDDLVQPDWNQNDEKCA